MAAGRARIPFCQRAHVAVARAYDLGRAVGPPYDERVGLHLVPLESDALARYANGQPVLLARRHLRGMQYAVQSAVEVQEGHRVVVDGAPRGERTQFRIQLGHPLSAHVLGQVPRVRADVADASPLAREGRIGAPPRIIAALQLNALREPALNVLHVHQPEAAQLPLGNAGLHLLHGRIPRVGVSKRQRAPRCLHFLAQAQRLVERERQRFVQHHVEALVEGQRRLLVVRLVRRHDGHEVHPLAFRQRRLALHHLPVVAVNPPGIEVPLASCLHRRVIIAAKASAHQLDVVLHQRRAQMDWAYHGVAASAHHSHSKSSVIHHFSVL